MEYKRFNDKIYLRLDPEDEICRSLLSLAEKEKITAASVTGIGATADFTVGVFDLEKKQYREFKYSGNHEINALVGNVTTKDGAPYVHLHITCTGGDGKVVGGHLLFSVISLTAEIVVSIAEGKITRKRNEDLGINVWNF